MKAQQIEQTTISRLPRPSRRAILKGSLALGGAALTAGRSLTDSALGQDQSNTESTPTPVEAPVIAEWTVANPSFVYAAFDSIWVAGHHDMTTTRIDPATNEIAAVIEGTGDHAEDALVVDDVLWVTGQANDTRWIDPKTNSVPESAPRVPGSYHGMAFGSESLWIVDSATKVDRVDPATGELIASITYGPGYEDITSGVSFKAEFVWISRWGGQELSEQELIKIDPATNTIVSRTPYPTFIDQANALTGVPAGKGTDSLWLWTGPDATPGLLRVDPVTGQGLSFLRVAEDQMWGHFAVTDASIWLAGQDGNINQVDVASNRIVAAYDAGLGNIYAIAISFGSLWLEKYNQNLVQRLDIEA